ATATNNTTTVFFYHHFMSHAQLVALTTNTSTGRSDVYERRLPDGSKEIYSLPDGTRPGAGSRRIFLTAIVDPAGNQLKINYDSRFRITSVVDALNQTVTLSYDLPSDPLKITKVTDPFGRTATLIYAGQGHLAGVTDVAGLTSRFVYDN